MQIGSNNSHLFGTNVNGSSPSKQTDSSAEKKQNSQNPKLDSAQQQQVNKLQARDTEVRAHEAAHKSAGGGLAGSASYSYQKGPDGKMYAIGGEVSISFKEGSTPQETVANAKQVVAAALAPANPSPQDYSVASSARMMEMNAQQEVVKEMQEKRNAKESYNQNQNYNELQKDNKNSGNLDIAI